MVPPKRLSSLRENIRWTFLGNLTAQAAQYVLIALLTKTGEAGQANPILIGSWLAMSVVNLTDLGLRAVQATDAKREYQFGDYLALRLVTSALAAFAIGGIAMWRWQSGRDTPWAAVTVGLIGAMRILESLADLFHARLQQHEYMEPIAQSLMARGALSVLAGAGVLWSTHSVFWLAMSLVLVRLLLLVQMDIPWGTLRLNNKVGGAALQERLLPDWTWSRQRSLLGIALPLGITTAFAAWISSIPRLMAEDPANPGLQEAFGAMTSLIAAGTIVISAVGAAASPRLAHYYAAHQRRQFFALVVKLLVLGAALGIAGVLVAMVGSKTLLTLIFSSRIAEYHGAFPWIMLAAGITFQGNLLGYTLTATRGFQRYVLPYGLLTAVTWLSGWLLIRPAWGIWGPTAVLGVSGVGLCLVPLIVLFADENLRVGPVAPSVPLKAGEPTR